MRGKSVPLLLVLALLTVLAIAAIWTLKTPRYRAKAELRIRPIIPRLVFRTEDNGAILLYESFVNTQASVMRSLIVLQRVLDQQEIRQTQWYKEPPKSIRQRLSGNSYTPIERLRDALSVKPRRRTEIIDVSFMAPSAKEAKLIVDIVLKQYMKYTGESSDAREEAIYKQLVEQYKSLEQDIDGLESITAAFSKSLGTTNPETLISAKRARLDQAKADLSKLEQIIGLLKWEIKEANAVDSNEAAGLPITVGGPSDLDATGLPVVIAGASNLSGEKKLAFLEHQLARTIQQRDLLETDVKMQETEFNELWTTARLLEKEDKRMKHKTELFTAVRQRLDQKTVERNVPGAISILTQAVAPSKPHNDRRILFTAIVLGLSLAVGSGIVLLQRTHVGDGSKGQRE